MIGRKKRNPEAFRSAAATLPSQTHDDQRQDEESNQQEDESTRDTSNQNASKVLTAASVFKLLNEEQKENAPEQEVENAADRLKIVKNEEDNIPEEEHKVPIKVDIPHQDDAADQETRKETAASTQPTIVNTEQTVYNDGKDNDRWADMKDNNDKDQEDQQFLLSREDFTSEDGLIDFAAMIYAAEAALAN